MNIALIGPRGSGKSKLSRRLSKITGMPVVSTDMVAVYETGGIPIPELIKRHNGDWRYFRDLEFSILKKLQNAEGIILDCGGGIVFDVDEKGNESFSTVKAELLRSFTTIIALSRPEEYLIKKIKNDPSRPPLSQITSYEAILKKRMPFYLQTAHHSLFLEDIGPIEAAEQILALVSSPQKDHH